jgi:hypothetical protein
MCRQQIEIRHKAMRVGFGMETTVKKGEKGMQKF